MNGQSRAGVQNNPTNYGSKNRRANRWEEFRWELNMQNNWPTLVGEHLYRFGPVSETDWLGSTGDNGRSAHQDRASNFGQDFTFSTWKVHKCSAGILRPSNSTAAPHNGPFSKFKFAKCSLFGLRQTSNLCTLRTNSAGFKSWKEGSAHLLTRKGANRRFNTKWKSNGCKQKSKSMLVGVIGFRDEAEFWLLNLIYQINPKMWSCSWLNN